jgi:hypothetical protein
MNAGGLRRGNDGVGIGRLLEARNVLCHR